MFLNIPTHVGCIKFKTNYKYFQGGINVHSEVARGKKKNKLVFKFYLIPEKETRNKNAKYLIFVVYKYLIHCKNCKKSHNCFKMITNTKWINNFL